VRRLPRRRDRRAYRLGVSEPPSASSALPALDHDAITQNRIVISSLCLSMIFSENRFPLFRIML
jgi:hypothetical protein